MQTNIPAGGIYPDLLSDILNIEVRKDDEITEEDRQFCQNQQDKLYETLKQLEEWYETFKAKAEPYTEKYKITYKPNGSIEVQELYRSYEEKLKDYIDFEFTPFKPINKIVQLYFNVNHAFAKRIVSYFNDTYNISVPEFNIDEDTLTMNSRPVYTTYVDHVIHYLGGRGFRDVAEAELISKFHSVVKPSCWSKVKPELKGCRIVFPDILRFDPFYFTYGQNKIYYGDGYKLAKFCAGIAFGAEDTLHGNSRMVIGFNGDDVDVTQWYELTTSNAEQMKFYKNGRIDVKFKNEQAAAECFQKLKLNEICLRGDNN